MKHLKKMLDEMDDAQRHADEMKEKITGVLIDERHVEMFFVNWRKLRMWVRRNI
jgi:DNA polymerase III sliding clamp (beta) subunit (PCNA family)